MEGAQPQQPPRATNGGVSKQAESKPPLLDVAGMGGRGNGVKGDEELDRDKQQKDVQVADCQGELVEAAYRVGETLGKGSFAVVKTGFRRVDGQNFAIKIIEKTNTAFDAESLRKEIAIMRTINHRNCIRLHEVYQGPDQICLVLDLVTGGELFDRIIAKGYYSEKDAAEVTRDVLNAVAYLHCIGIVHRDLKPENLLYMSNDEAVPEYNQIKVADFGLARSTQFSTNPMRTMCGTPGYVAPEVLDPRITAPDGYGPEVDIWSVGVVLYIMLCGFPPFYSDSTVTLFRQIRRGEFTFPSPFWDNISPAAKDLVCRMLVVNPRKRQTAQQCLQHPWIANASKQEQRSLGSQHKAFLIIRRLPLFDQINPECLSEITTRLKRVTASAGEYIIRAGSEGTCMYFVGSTPQNTIGSGMQLGEELARGIVRSRCLDVFVDGVRVTQLGTGDYFGEVALVGYSDNKRTADVVATSPLELYELSRADVFAVTQQFPILQGRLQLMAQARLLRANSTPSESPNNSLCVTPDSPEDDTYYAPHPPMPHPAAPGGPVQSAHRRHGHGETLMEQPMTKKTRRGANGSEADRADMFGMRVVPTHQWIHQPPLMYVERPEATPRLLNPFTRIGSRYGMMEPEHAESVTLVQDVVSRIEWSNEPTLASLGEGCLSPEAVTPSGQMTADMGALMRDGGWVAAAAGKQVADLNLLRHHLGVLQQGGVAGNSNPGSSMGSSPMQSVSQSRRASQQGGYASASASSRQGSPTQMPSRAPFCQPIGTGLPQSSYGSFDSSPTAALQHHMQYMGLQQQLGHMSAARRGSSLDGAPLGGDSGEYNGMDSGESGEIRRTSSEPLAPPDVDAVEQPTLMLARKASGERGLLEPPKVDSPPAAAAAAAAGGLVQGLMGLGGGGAQVVGLVGGVGLAGGVGAGGLGGGASYFAQQANAFHEHQKEEQQKAHQPARAAGKKGARGPASSKSFEGHQRQNMWNFDQSGQALGANKAGFDFSAGMQPAAHVQDPTLLLGGGFGHFSQASAVGMGALGLGAHPPGGMQFLGGANGLPGGFGLASGLQTSAAQQAALQQQLQQQQQQQQQQFQQQQLNQQQQVGPLMTNLGNPMGMGAMGMGVMGGNVYGMGVAVNGAGQAGVRGMLDMNSTDK